MIGHVRCLLAVWFWHRPSGRSAGRRRCAFSAGPIDAAPSQ